MKRASNSALAKLAFNPRGHGIAVSTIARHRLFCGHESQSQGGFPRRFADAVADSDATAIIPQAFAAKSLANRANFAD